MIPHLRHRAAIPICLALNLLLAGACLLVHDPASSGVNGSEKSLPEPTAAAHAVGLRAKIVDRIRDDPGIRLFRPPQKPSTSAAPVQRRDNGSEPARLVGIILSEPTGETGIAVVELEDHRIVRVRVGAKVQDTSWTVRRIGHRSVELDLGSGRRVLTLN
ncbi:hypothetical protein [Methylobacterium mesophilicum]|uniref:hypothetical protein n=1 Tax=Methylobacterium mesophilicum TaxID=39956 RepID=UPI002F2F41BD